MFSISGIDLLNTRPPATLPNADDGAYHLMGGSGLSANDIRGGTRDGGSGIGGGLGNSANGTRDGTRTRASGWAFHVQFMVIPYSPQPFARFSAPVGGAMVSAHRPNGPAEPSEGLGPGGWMEYVWPMNRETGPCPGARPSPTPRHGMTRTSPTPRHGMTRTSPTPRFGTITPIFP